MLDDIIQPHLAQYIEKANWTERNNILLAYVFQTYSLQAPRTLLDSL